MVSIVVPCYNVEQYIEACVQSLLSQKYKDIEIILINDGSKDNTPLILENISKKDSRIKIFHQANLGVSETRNIGIRHAQGKYICFVDSDDCVTEDYISSMMSAMEEFSADIVLSGREIHYRNGTIEKYTPELKILQNHALREFFFEPSFKLIRGGPFGKLFVKSIIIENNIKFPSGIHYLEDAIFVLDYLLHSNSLVSVPVNSYKYLLHSDSLVFTIHDFETEALGYNAFKTISDDCTKRFMLDKNSGWLVDNLLFMIHRQIKSANRDLYLLDKIDWDFYHKHFKASTIKGKLFKSLQTHKWGRMFLVKFNFL